MYDMIKGSLPPNRGVVVGDIMSRTKNSDSSSQFKCFKMVAAEIENGQGHHKVLALFDVDGTLTVPRKVGWMLEEFASCGQNFVIAVGPLYPWEIFKC